MPAPRTNRNVRACSDPNAPLLGLALHMITIQQFDDTAIPDPQALAMFQRQWAIYLKIIDHNYLHHRETRAALHQALKARPPGPLRLVDLACGDASTTRQALRGVAISHYRGIDLSRPALEAAALTLADLDCEVVLEQRDFSTALAHRPASADLCDGPGLVAVGVPDVLAACDRLRHEGLELLQEPATARKGGAKIALIRDPEGYVVELIERA